MSEGSVRLQKYLASAGVSSRRKAEELITAGRVKVNSRTVTELGTKVEPGRDLVTVDGRLVSPAEGRAYYLLYKPPGCVTTASDPEGRPTALDYLRNVKERVFPVGRLDFDAEGALLFTDDGELANRLAHPRYGHRRTYLVKVKGDPEPEALLRMTAGVRLDDGPARALEANVHERAEKNVWVRVVVAEGRFHLVKRLCEAVGLQVQRLFRPEFGGLTVSGLRAGKFRALDPMEVRSMRRAVGLDGGEAEPQRSLPRSALPKAARRHGHGPPAAPGSGPGEALDEGADESPTPRQARSAAPQREPRERDPARHARGETTPPGRPAGAPRPAGRPPRSAAPPRGRGNRHGSRSRR